jgi:RNA polymerase sigma-32 factor
MKGRKRPFATKKKPAQPARAASDTSPGDDVQVVDRDEDDAPVAAVDDEPEVVDVDVEDAEPEVDVDPDVLERDAAVEIDVDEKPAKREPGLARRDPLSVYMAEIRRIPLLSREEEHELAKKYFETGDLAIARQLVTANLRLVVKIAHEYRRAYRNLLDLVQEGNVGLMQAMKKYDPHRGVKLSSYAAWWIRAYILKFILNNWRLVKIGTTQAQRKLFFNLRKEKEKLEQQGFAPEHRLLAERLDVTVDEVAEMERRLDGADMSLDAPLGREDPAGATRLDVLPSGSATRPDVRAESDELRGLLKEKLEAFAAGLDGRDAVLFRERWLTEEPKTLQELGDKFNISRERARQLEKRMLDNLRRYLEDELGTEVDIGSLATEE